MRDIVVVSSVVLAPAREEILTAVPCCALHDPSPAADAPDSVPYRYHREHRSSPYPPAEDTINVMSIAHLLTGAGPAWRVLTGLIAAMLGHSLQSMVVFGQVLIFGRGDTDVHPLLWILVFGCPIWVYLGSQLMRVMLPRR